MEQVTKKNNNIKLDFLTVIGSIMTLIFNLISNAF